MESERTATDTKLLSPGVAFEARPRFVTVNVVRGDSVQVSGEPVQVNEELCVLFIALFGQAETVTVSLALPRVQALVDTLVCVCSGAAIAGGEALLGLALRKVLLYWLGPLVMSMAAVTLHPALMQLIGSSARQSPPPVERTWARSPLPT